jgi:hypothetical protein
MLIEQKVVAGGLWGLSFLLFLEPSPQTHTDRELCQAKEAMWVVFRQHFLYFHVPYRGVPSPLGPVLPASERQRA